MNKKSSQNRQLLFWVITIAIPFVFLILIELSLVLFGYRNQAQELFIELPGYENYMISNPDFVGRYFPNFTPNIAPQPFEKEKSGNTFRVFVMGGSSTQGFPYNFYNSFSGTLAYRLRMEAKGKKVEVINLGMTAVNSYVLWDLKDRVMKYEPDAIVIYAGHNEYYGSFGVGSSQFGVGNSIGIKRLIINLKSLRLYQLIEQTLKPEDENRENRTLMARAVAESSIELNSKVYNAGLDQFESNMTDVLSYFDKNEVPVFIGSLASNLADQSPMGSDEEAMSSFNKAKRFVTESQIDSAIYHFERSKELDDIRFRAPEGMNDIIDELTKTYNATLVDVQAMSFDSSDTGLPDNSLFDDHLHPNGLFNQMIGEAFFEAISTSDMLKSNFSPNSLSIRLAISKFEEAHSETPITRLKSGFPFTQGLSGDAEMRLFNTRFYEQIGRSPIDSLAAVAWRAKRPLGLALTDAINLGIMSKDSANVVKHYYDIAHWQVFNDGILKKGVNYSINDRRFDERTVALLEFILSYDRTDNYYHNSLGAIYLINQEIDRAEYWLSESEKLNPNHPNLLFNMARLKAMQRDTLASRDYFMRYRQVISQQQQAPSQ